MEETLYRSRAHVRLVMYILGFLFSLHIAMLSFINSSFLSGFTGEDYVGTIYTVASLFTILVFLFIPKLLERFGNYRTIVGMLFVELISVVGMAYFQSLWYIVPMFAAHFVATAIANFNIDIFLENISTENTVGRIRGFYLTAANTAWVVAPLLTGLILTNGDYWKIYLAAAVILAPIIGLLSTNMRNFVDPTYAGFSLGKTIRTIWANENILGGYMVSFILQVFYALMTIYTPIYLHTHIGFGWDQIGIMFSIMLLPFIFIEIPLGKLADSRWGEKEILSIGFIIMAISTAAISFIDSNNFFVWTAILFITRIGASMAEVGGETYFFKKIDGSSVSLMSIYRTMRPFAYLLSPLFATLILSMLTEFKYIFVVVGLVMFYGLRWSLALEDTR